ncbi:hypothetical protein Tco_0879060 [Tanacetum coccineum]
MKVMGCSWKMGVVAWSGRRLAGAAASEPHRKKREEKEYEMEASSVIAIENTGSDVVGMENEESDGDGPVNGGDGYGEVIVMI